MMHNNCSDEQKMCSEKGCFAVVSVWVEADLLWPKGTIGIKLNTPSQPTNLGVND